MNARFHPCLRALGLVLTVSTVAGLGLTTAPTRAADATLGRDLSPIALSGAEQWILRPGKAAPAVAVATPRPPRAIPLSDLPNERRTVRIVYQGYQQTGAIPADR